MQVFSPFRFSQIVFWLPVLGMGLVAFVVFHSEVPSRIWKGIEAERKKVINDVKVVKTESNPEPSADELPAVDPAPSDLAPESFSLAGLSAAGGFGNSGGMTLAAGGGGFSAEALRAAQSNRPARVLSRSEPSFPLEARRKGIAGVVEVRVLVGPSGQVESVQVEKADPPGVFERSALTAVRNWKFSPAFQDGKVSSSWIRQRIRYDLQ